MACLDAVQRLCQPARTQQRRGQAQSVHKQPQDQHLLGSPLLGVQAPQQRREHQLDTCTVILSNAPMCLYYRHLSHTTMAACLSIAGSN